MERKRGCGCGASVFLVLIGMASLVLMFPFVGLTVFVLAATGALVYGWIFAREKEGAAAAKKDA